MTGWTDPDPPTNRDRSRIRAARARARSFTDEIAERRRAALLRVFRAEIGATVRSVSPFLVSILEVEDRSVDDIAPCIFPADGWPRRPRLGDMLEETLGPKRHVLRHYLAGVLTRPGAARSLPADLHGCDFVLYGGGCARVKVVGHSLEVEVAFKAVRLETRFGMLRIGLDRRMPEILAAACIGTPVESIVDHAALRGRGWTIAFVEEPSNPLDGQVLCVATGSMAYQLPWARAGNCGG